MKKSEYQAQLQAAYTVGREAIPFDTCVELCVLGAVLPEVREKARWQCEYEFALNWHQRSGRGLDARFTHALDAELREAKRILAGTGKLPPWAAQMARERYKMELPEGLA